MGKISAEAFRRIYLLYVLAQFAKGSYGSVRLQKITYITEREPSQVRPFKYRKWHHGQYSEQMEDIKDQLTSMGFIAATPLDTATVLEFAGEAFNLGGNRLYLRDDVNRASFATVLASVSNDLPRHITATVDQFGYLPEDKLLKLCYAFPEFEAADEGDTIYESNLGDSITVDLPDEECDDLELALNPEFVMSMSRLATSLEKKGVDWSRVREVEQLRASGS